METTIGRMRVGLDVAFEEAQDVILITDLAGVIHYVNSAFDRVTGYAREEVIGHHARMLKSGKHDAAFYRNLWRTLSDGHVWHGTFLNRRKDGRLYEDATVISPVRNDAGSVMGYLAVKRDVTGERERERQLLHVRTMEALSRVAGGMAHDFNNALMTIMGHIEMLEARLGEAEGSNEEIVEIKAACDRVASLTRQLLAFDPRARGELAVLDASRVVAGLEKMLRRLLGEDIELVVNPGSGPALVRFEVGKIEQILLDLAVREREGMPTGGTFTVTVCEPESQPSNGSMLPVAEDIGNWTEVRVTGTGLGLDAQCLAWCREPGESETVPPWAAGLGLGTVPEAIWRSGGRMTARSGPGEEMTITIHLRRAAPDRAHLFLSRSGTRTACRDPRRFSWRRMKWRCGTSCAVA